MSFLRQENGKLLQFWASYLDIVGVLLGLLKASQDGNWELHLSQGKWYLGVSPTTTLTTQGMSIHVYVYLSRTMSYKPVACANRRNPSAHINLSKS